MPRTRSKTTAKQRGRMGPAKVIADTRTAAQKLPTQRRPRPLQGLSLLRQTLPLSLLEAERERERKVISHSSFGISNHQTVSMRRLRLPPRVILTRGGRQILVRHSFIRIRILVRLLLRRPEQISVAQQGQLL